MLINLDRVGNYLILSQVQFRQIDAHKKLINFTWFSALISISITKTKLKEEKRKKINKIACEIQFLFTLRCLSIFALGVSFEFCLQNHEEKKALKLGVGFILQMRHHFLLLTPLKSRSSLVAEIHHEPPSPSTHKAIFHISSGKFHSPYREPVTLVLLITLAAEGLNINK